MSAPSRRQAWGWFIGLGLGGFMATAFLAYSIKFLLKLF